MKTLRLPLAILFSCFAVPVLFATTTCTNPPLLGNAGNSHPRWGASAVVQINVGSPTATQKLAVQAAADSWDAYLVSTWDCAPFFTFGGTGLTTTANIHMNWVPASGFPADTSTGNDDDATLTGGVSVLRGLTHFSTATPNSNSGPLLAIDIYILSAITSQAAYTELIAHEFGHTLDLGDCTGCAAGSSVMVAGILTSDGTINGTVGSPGPTQCDINVIKSKSLNYVCAPGVASTTPPCVDVGVASNAPLLPWSWALAAWRKPQSLNGPPGGSGGGGGGGGNSCPSPIIIDLSGKGFHLTNAANGVQFDMSGSGNLIQTAWIAEGANNAFLALPGPDGLVHNGQQLFGNFTPQPVSSTPNGFAALAVYDLPANGGNGDGVIDSDDAIYNSLRLWIDSNHDGICQPGELYTLPSLGVESISLDYSTSRRTDRYGNVFRFKAAVDPNDSDPSHVGRTAYDVFFVTGPTPTKSPEQLQRHMEVLTAAKLRSKCKAQTPKKTALWSTGGL
jgi:hypothetical protein